MPDGSVQIKTSDILLLENMSEYELEGKKNMNEISSVTMENGIVTCDYFIDKITESKYFDGFPIISQTLAILRAGKLISNFLYTKKIYAFLDGIKSDKMDSDRFSDAMKKLNKNPEKFQEELLFLIEKAENTEKAKLLGYFTRYLALGEISYDDFLLFTNAVNNIQISFLKDLSKIYRNKEEISKSVLFGILQAQGFVIKYDEIEISPESNSYSTETQYSEKFYIFGEHLNSFFSMS